jgi:hypothetical protein
LPPPHTHGQLHLSAGHLSNFCLLTTTKAFSLSTVVSFTSMVLDELLDDEDELLLEEELEDEELLLEEELELDELLEPRLNRS